jgi:uncharacterized protein
MKHLVLALALSSSLVACKEPAPQVLSALQVPPVPPALMSVTGTATLDIAPDCADLTMTITSDGSLPGLAMSALQRRRAELVAALKRSGVETADLKLSQISLNPIYDRRLDGVELRVATYRASITLTATTRDFDRIAPIMDAGAQAGSSQMSTAFRRSDLPALKKKVRDLAIAAAKEKALQMAKAVGVELGHVLSVAEASRGQMWSNEYFPGNLAASAPSTGDGIAGTSQTLSLDITIGYELARS